MPYVMLTEHIKFEIDSDMEHDPTLPKKSRNINMLKRYRPNLFPPGQRVVAGSKRVERYRERQGLVPGESRAQVLQSVRVKPGLGDRCFEELRAECYSQSAIATGMPPRPVDMVETPWAAIPPAFNAFRDEHPDEGLLVPDVAMAEDEDGQG